jgi:hypothetical protein
MRKEKATVRTKRKKSISEQNCCENIEINSFYIATRNPVAVLRDIL